MIPRLEKRVFIWGGGAEETGASVCRGLKQQLVNSLLPAQTDLAGMSDGGVGGFAENCRRRRGYTQKGNRAHLQLKRTLRSH